MSMTPRTLDDLLDLAPGYLFGDLDATELAAFEQALRTPEYAAALEAQLALLQGATDALVQDGAVTPPPALRDRLQARIALEAGTQQAAQVAGEVARRPSPAFPVPALPTPASSPSAPTPAPHVPDALDEIRARLNANSAAADRRAEAREGPPAAAPTVVRATPSSRAVRVTPQRVGAVPDDPSRRRTSKAGWYVSAVLAAGLAATVTFTVDLRNRFDAVSADARDRIAQLTRLEKRLSDKDRTLSTLLAGRGNVVLVTLDATTPTGPGMQVFWNVREGKAVVNAYGLAQVAANRAYMLWMIRDGAPVPVKLFTPDESGRALVSDVEVPTSTSGITVFAVTEESAQGAPAPTMTPFLAGTVAAPK